MGRLIDAEKITEVDCRGLEGYVKPEHYEIVASFFFEKFINCQPTAYDVDKVVEEMNEALIKLGGGNDCSRCAFREICDRGCIETMIEVYKSIARKGGVND